jgi:hypothetical protein
MQLNDMNNGNIAWLLANNHRSFQVLASAPTLPATSTLTFADHLSTLQTNRQTERASPVSTSTIHSACMSVIRDSDQAVSCSVGSRPMLVLSVSLHVTLLATSKSSPKEDAAAWHSLIDMPVRPIATYKLPSVSV